MTKTYSLLGFAIVLLMVAAIVAINTNGGVETEATAPIADRMTQPDLLLQTTPSDVPSKIIKRRAYTMSYNSDTRTANWVAWTLTREHTYGSNQRSDQRFEEDPEVPTPRATYQDYYNSRYDRGHLCPAGDNKWDTEAMTETFLMTNICPQNHGLNKEDWNTLEQQCRTWARRYGEVTIVCGPVFDAEAQPRRIGRNKVQVPDAFFKIVYRSKPQPAALAVVMKNIGDLQPWEKHLLSVDDVEILTGIDFLPQLADDIEETVEATTTPNDWQ